MKYCVAVNQKIEEDLYAFTCKDLQDTLKCEKSKFQNSIFHSVLSVWNAF